MYVRNMSYDEERGVHLWPSDRWDKTVKEETD